MSEADRFVESRIVRPLALVLAAAAAIRLLAAVVAGFVEWHDSATEDFFGRVRAFDVLTTFGSGGDGTGVLLALAAAALVCVLLWRDDAFALALHVAVMWLFGVTAVLAVAEGTGVGLLYSEHPGHQTARLLQGDGFALAYVVVAIGAIVLLGRFGVLLDERSATDDIDAFVFAVDRKSGDVRAFLSVRDARRGMHVYSVEDDEFAFYADDGAVLNASVEDDRITFRSTDQEQPEVLLSALKEFADRRGIRIDEAEADDPTAYAVPISRWHWLEMWPPWLRPIGMIFRRTG